jgi:type II secretory pathway pseudopilin PulG
MTLVEMVLVITIIGLLAALLLPAFAQAMRSRQTAECARKLRIAVDAFELYAAESGSYPPDQTVPGELSVPAMEDYYFPYFKINWWGDSTELGGRWDWDAGYHGFNFSVSIWSPAAPAEQMLELDRLVDDGNLNTGNFRQVDSQYHYIIED